MEPLKFVLNRREKQLNINIRPIFERVEKNVVEEQIVASALEQQNTGPHK